MMLFLWTRGINHCVVCDWLTYWSAKGITTSGPEVVSCSCLTSLH